MTPEELLADAQLKVRERYLVCYTFDRAILEQDAEASRMNSIATSALVLEHRGLVQQVVVDHMTHPEGWIFRVCLRLFDDG